MRIVIRTMGGNLGRAREEVTANDPRTRTGHENQHENPQRFTLT